MNQAHNPNRRGMFSPSGFRDLVSGRRGGAAAGIFRGILALAEGPYAWIVRRRNRRYDRGQNRVQGVEVPVISVGNLTLGGTGKTPMVEWIVRQLRGQGKKVGIVSRGYAARGEANDEALELAWNLPDVPHVQNPDRLAAARRAIDEFGCEVLVLDDAFQHRRIARDLDIVLLDALEPLGFEHVFPRGTLREPVQGLARAHVVVLSRADLLTAPERQALRERVAKLSPSAAWAEVVHAPLALVAARCAEQAGGTPAPQTRQAGETPALQQQSLERLRGRRVLAFCGLGNPAGFRHTLAVCGYEVVEFREFPDHHHYTQADLESLAATAGQLKVEAVVCTKKDLVKIGRDHLGDCPLWAVGVGIEFLAGQGEVEKKLAGLQHFHRMH